MKTLIKTVAARVFQKKVASPLGLALAFIPNAQHGSTLALVAVCVNLLAAVICCIVPPPVK